MIPIQTGKTGKRRTREAGSAGEDTAPELTSRQRVGNTGRTATFNAASPETLRADSEQANVGNIRFELDPPPSISTPAHNFYSPAPAPAPDSNTDPYFNPNGDGLTAQAGSSHLTAELDEGAIAPTVEQSQQNIPPAEPLIHGTLTFKSREILRNVRAYYLSPEGELKQTEFKALRLTVDKQGNKFMVSVHEENGQTVIERDDRGKPVIALNKNCKPHSPQSARYNEVILDEMTGQYKTRHAIELYQRHRTHKPEDATPTGELKLSTRSGPVQNVKGWFKLPDGTLQETIFETLRLGYDTRKKTFMVSVHEENGQTVIKCDDSGNPIIALTHEGNPFGHTNARKAATITDETSRKIKNRQAIKQKQKYHREKPESAAPTGKLTLSPATSLLYNVKAWFRSPEGELKQGVFKTLGLTTDESIKTFMVSVHEENGQTVIKCDERGNPIIALTQEGNPHNHNSASTGRMIRLPDGTHATRRSVTDREKRARNKAPVPPPNQSCVRTGPFVFKAGEEPQQTPATSLQIAKPGQPLGPPPAPEPQIPTEDAGNNDPFDDEDLDRLLSDSDRDDEAGPPAPEPQLPTEDAGNNDPFDDDPNLNLFKNDNEVLKLLLSDSDDEAGPPPA